MFGALLRICTRLISSTIVGNLLVVFWLQLVKLNWAFRIRHFSCWCLTSIWIGNRDLYLPGYHGGNHGIIIEVCIEGKDRNCAILQSCRGRRADLDFQARTWVVAASRLSWVSRACCVIAPGLRLRGALHRRGWTARPCSNLLSAADFLGKSDGGSLIFKLVDPSKLYGLQSHAVVETGIDGTSCH